MDPTLNICSGVNTAAHPPPPACTAQPSGATVKTPEVQGLLPCSHLPLSPELQRLEVQLEQEVIRIDMLITKNEIRPLPNQRMLH